MRVILVSIVGCLIGLFFFHFVHVSRNMYTFMVLVSGMLYGYCTYNLL
jgi:hypothetical protein